MLSRTPVRDDDCLTPPVRRYLRWLMVSMSVYASLLVRSLFALRAAPADAMLLRALFRLLPALFGTYGLAKAVVARRYAG